jgi:hypothetical protein
MPARASTRLELEDSFLRLPADRVEIAYAESYLVARYLLAEYTTRHLHALLERIGSGRRWKALRAVLPTPASSS